MNSCGTCTMCCRLMGVHDLVPPKSRNEWCTHVCKSSGCGIYDSRPESCRTFECIWLQSQSEPNPMPVKHRPDQIKVMLVPLANDAGVEFVCVPDRPDAWKAFEVVMHRLHVSGSMIGVTCGDKRYSWKPGRGLRRMRTISIDPETGIEMMEVDD